VGFSRDRHSLILVRSLTSSLKHSADAPEGYGWISILLHWIVAAAVVVLWFLGDSIDAVNLDENRPAQISRHVSFALTMYVFLLLRVLWRVRNGHPRWPDQSQWDRRLSRVMHYSMLAAIVLMMISGPCMLLSAGQPVQLFADVDFPRFDTPIPWLHQLAYRAHALGGRLLLITVICHICGACKHLMFDDDDVFIRILAPPRHK